MHPKLLIPLAAGLMACRPDDPEPQDPSGVLRDCEAAPGRICPWAGSGDNGWNGEGKDRLDAMFSFPMSVTFSPYGPPMVADWNNHKIRMLEDDDTFTTVMGTDFLGDGDPGRLDMTSFGAPGTEVNLNHPTMQQYLSDGTMLSASWHTHKLRTLTLDDGLVHVVLGSAPGFAPAEPTDDRGAPVADDGCALNQPKSIEIDSDDNVYINDMRNERIRFWDRAAGTLRTLAGNGGKANAVFYPDPAHPDRVDAEAKCLDANGDLVAEGPALSVCLSLPKNSNPEPGGALALDEDAGLLYVADTEAHVIRVLDLDSGDLSILAGGYQEAGFADGDLASARFDFPADLELDRATRTLFVADANNHRIRAIDLASGKVSTFAGTGEPTCSDGSVVQVGDGGFTILAVLCDEQKRGGDGGPATKATLYRPFGVDLDLDGNLVISDTYNQRLRVVYR